MTPDELNEWAEAIETFCAEEENMLYPGNWQKCAAFLRAAAQPKTVEVVDSSTRPITDETVERAGESIAYSTMGITARGWIRADERTRQEILSVARKALTAALTPTETSTDAK